MSEAAGTFPSNYESLSELEALREAVGDEIGYWFNLMEQHGKDSPVGQQAWVALTEWTSIRRNMLSEDPQQLRIVASALRAAQAARQASAQQVA